MGRDASEGASDNPDVLPFVLIQGPPGVYLGCGALTAHMCLLQASCDVYAPVVLYLHAANMLS